LKYINNEYNIWEEKYRPQVLEDLILPEEYRKQFAEYMKQDMLPNMLFTSSIAGAGKCLDYEEDIEVYVNEEMFKKLQRFLDENRLEKYNT